MTDPEYQAIRARVEKGDVIDPVDFFIFDLERQARNDELKVAKEQTNEAENRDGDLVTRWLAQHRIA